MNKTMCWIKYEQVIRIWERDRFHTSGLTAVSFSGDKYWHDLAPGTAQEEKDVNYVNEW